MISCLLKNDPASCLVVLSLTLFMRVGIGKPSLKRAHKMYCKADPKPGELTMSRVSGVERHQEARTRQCCNTVG